jgi:hypothetical protein
MLEDEIAVGMWKGFSGARGGGTKVPLDVPEVLDERCQLGWRNEALVKEGAAIIPVRLQHAARQIHGWRKMRWLASRFFNLAGGHRITLAGRGHEA